MVSLAKFASEIIISHCQFGENFQKRIKLMHWNCDSSPVCTDCKRGQRLCAYPHTKHVALTGLSTTGFRTALASSYPWPMASVVSNTFGNFIVVSRNSSSPRCCCPAKELLTTLLGPAGCTQHLINSCSMPVGTEHDEFRPPSSGRTSATVSQAAERLWWSYARFLHFLWHCLGG